MHVNVCASVCERLCIQCMHKQHMCVCPRECVCLWCLSASVHVHAYASTSIYELVLTFLDRVQLS